MFIDETWAKTNMTRRYGRCRRGARLVAKVPHGRWRTLTFLAALRHDRITAPCVIDGPINGASFRAYIEQFLVPTLSPGDVVVVVSGEDITFHGIIGKIEDGYAFASDPRGSLLPAGVQ